MDINAFFPENERPLDHLLPDSGFCGIFRTVACVGDSLSSGEFQITDETGKNHYYDMFEYSWGQYMARAAGMKVYNFSKGGMTAKKYMESFAEEKGFWDPDLKAQAYIIALGVNDIFNQGQPLGSVDDIKPDWRDNADTYAGHYGAIVQRYKEISPHAKFFFVVPPRGCNPKQEEVAEPLAELLRAFPGRFENSYVIDLRRYAPVYDEEFRKRFFLFGHMNPAGYLLTAKIIMSYLDYIIRHNMNDFERLGFVPH